MRLEEHLLGAGSSMLVRNCQNNSFLATAIACGVPLSPTAGAKHNAAQFKGERLIGLEFEIEGMEDSEPPNMLALAKKQATWDDVGRLWGIHSDGSLRNHGKEFVTRLGVTLERIKGPLEILNRCWSICYVPKALSVTSRCSVHVHYNVWDYTVDQLRSLIFVYSIIESAMYFVSGNRTNNIFCVPNSRMPRSTWKNLFSSEYEDSGFNVFSPFYKYAGLNLQPVLNYGTIEFRHHKGVSNPMVVVPWLTIIHEMCESSRIHSLKDWKAIAQEAWENNQLPDLVEFISPSLYESVKHLNLNVLLEGDIKAALWVSTDQSLIPKLDNDDVREPRRTRNAIKVALPDAPPSFPEDDENF